MRKVYLLLEVPYVPSLIEKLVTQLRSLPILVPVYYVSTSLHAWELMGACGLDGVLTPDRVKEKVQHEDSSH